MVGDEKSVFVSLTTQYRPMRYASRAHPVVAELSLCHCCTRPSELRFSEDCVWWFCYTCAKALKTREILEFAHLAKMSSADHTWQEVVESYTYRPREVPSLSPEEVVRMREFVKQDIKRRELAALAIPIPSVAFDGKFFAPPENDGADPPIMVSGETK